MATQKGSHSTASSQARSRTARPEAVRRHEVEADRCTRNSAEVRAEREEPSPTLTRPTPAFLQGAWGDVHDARAYLGNVSLSVVRRETRVGRIKAYVIGGRKLVRYRRSDLDAYLESQAVVTPFAPRKRA